MRSPASGRRSGRARPVADHLKPLTRKCFGRRGFADSDMIVAWPSVIGAELARLSAPERVIYPKGRRSGGTLHLRIASGSIAVELQHMLPLLVERINGYFGYRAVDHVRLVQAPIPVPTRDARNEAHREAMLGDADMAELTRMLGDIDDPEIRASLERLGASLMKRKGGA